MPQSWQGGKGNASYLLMQLYLSQRIEYVLRNYTPEFPRKSDLHRYAYASMSKWELTKMITAVNQSNILVVDITEMWKQVSQYDTKKFKQRKCIADPTEKQNPIKGKAHCCKNTDLRFWII